MAKAPLVRGKAAPRVRRDPNGRAADILVTALDLFARRDFTSVTVRDIAKACDINIALIYYYFGSTEELFRASIEFAIKQAIGDYDRLRTRNTDPIEALDGWFDINIELFETLRKMAKVTIDYFFSGTSVASIDRMIEKLYEDERRILAENIRDGVARGLFRTVDPVDTARFISTHLDGIFFSTMNRRNTDPAQSMRNLRATLLAYLGAGRAAAKRRSAVS
jgi:TetR/AcrR family transcriptional regulator, upper aerobic nicotinate degradation pathway regulator